MPAQQLRDRLETVFSDEPWQFIHAHGGVAGGPVNVKILIVHETTGYPPRNTGRAMFRRHFEPKPVPPPPKPPPQPPDRITSQLYVSGDGTVMQGMQLPTASGHAGFLNNRALGSETGHGWGNWRGNGPSQGPHTASNQTLIPDPHNPGDTMIEGSLIPTQRADRGWLPLSGNDAIAAAGDDDLPGVKFWAHTGFSEVPVAAWTTSRYPGPWRQPQRECEMLFTEQHYRAWALLARWICEEYLVPRNFSLYPHKTRSPGFGTAGSHGMVRDAVRFAEIVLADEALSRAPGTWGAPALAMPLTAATLQARYLDGVPAGADVNPHWQQTFSTFRGICGHGYPGDVVHGDHDCPGPMFDWHRFAREVWDWWWWPFDFDAAHPNNPVDPRPYSLNARDGNTALKEYYWSTPVATISGRARNGVHGQFGSPRTFELPANSRVYALATGDLVAARFPTEVANQVSLAFMVVRHDVYHQLDARPANPAANPPVFANRIDYNIVPTSVFTLYMHLGRPAGMNFAQVDTRNPDWLNRILWRKKEAGLGMRFRPTIPEATIPAAAWNDAPPGTPPGRPTVLEAWDADNTGLTTFLDTLTAGNMAIVPLAAHATPIRVLLGDYLGNAGVISAVAGGPVLSGVRVEVFSNTQVSNTDFALTNTEATTNDFRPNPGVGSPCVRYRSEWGRTPAGAEAAALQAAGVPVALVNWWRTFQQATLDIRIPDDATLPLDGHVIHYDPLTFIPWLNRRTWQSEWPKYRTGAADIPAAPRPR